MKNNSTTKRFKWTAKEYMLVFKQLKKLFPKIENLPKGNNFYKYPEIQSTIPVNNRRNFNSSSLSYAVRTAYCDWIGGSDEAAWMSILSRSTKIPAPEVWEPVIIKKPEVVTKRINAPIENLSSLFDSKLAPLTAMLTKLVMNTNVGIIAPVVVETETSQPAVTLLTESAIRNIVREEIEKIFGSINPSPQPTRIKETQEAVNVETKHLPSLKIIPSESGVPLSIAKKHTVTESIKPTCVIKRSSKMRIFIYGLTTAQLNIIRDAAPLNTHIDGSTNFSQSSKDLAKNSDSVIVTKFSSHSVYETLRGICGNEKVTFVSGGTSMIKRQIISITDGAIMRASA